MILFSAVLSAQEKKDVTVQKESHAAAAGMDKNYYDFYFETLPDKRASEKAKLEANLVRIARDEIQRKDHTISKEALGQIKPATITYEKVTSESIWVRGIRDIFKHLKYTDYMYVVKHDKYYVYVSFVMDPGTYIQTPFQAEVLFKKENVFLSSPANP